MKIMHRVALAYIFAHFKPQGDASRGNLSDKRMGIFYPVICSDKSDARIEKWFYELL